METPTVADQLEFESWPEEQQKLARKVLIAEIRKRVLVAVQDKLEDFTNEVTDLEVSLEDPA